MVLLSLAIDPRRLACMYYTRTHFPPAHAGRRLRRLLPRTTRPYAPKRAPQPTAVAAVAAVKAAAAGGCCGKGGKALLA